jgi:hypothetical protein
MGSGQTVFGQEFCWSDFNASIVFSAVRSNDLAACTITSRYSGPSGVSDETAVSCPLDSVFSDGNWLKLIG